MMRHLLILFLFAALASAQIGCGSSKTIQVSGTVTYNGEPVEKGEISFVDLGPEKGSDGGPIENGKFSFPARPGKKRVEIRGSRPLPPERQTSPEMGLLYEDFIPAAHHRDSTLTIEVAPGKQEFSFDLTLPK